MNRLRKYLTDERFFEKLVTILISSVAILVAITAFLQNYTSNISQQANRFAQQLSIQATTKSVTGAIQYSYDWESAFQTYREVDLQVVAAQQSGDQEAEDRYTKLRDRLASLSPILRSPYFDQKAQWPDTSQYVSNLYLIEATRLSEEYQAEAVIGQAWSDAANHFVIQLTLLTVALSLYGLSLTLRGRTRWMFVIVGSGIVGFCVLWLGVELILPKPVVSMPAIDAYSKAVGASYVGNSDEAIKLLDQAVAIKPDYANAYYERANAHLDKKDYQRAAADFKSALDAGRDDVNVYWNLGWTYYLLGRYDDAIAMNSAILDNDPTVLGMRMNQGLTKLAKGDLDGAKTEYDLLLKEAERQVSEAHANHQEPSASLWFYMDAGAVDLQNLIDQLDNHPKDWTVAPQGDLIKGDHQKARDFALEQMVRIKEAVVSLEYEGKLTSAQDVMKVSSFKFGNATSDDSGKVTDFQEVSNASFPNQTVAVTVAFNFTGPAPKKSLIWKVYYNGVEDPSLREVLDKPTLSQSQEQYKTIGFEFTNVFVLSPGEYTVELYTDDRLVQSGTFFVEKQ